MCGKAVSQRVWTDDLAHASQLAQLFDDVENHLSCQHRASPVQEQDVLAAALHCLAATGLLQVQIDLVDGEDFINMIAEYGIGVKEVKTYEIDESFFQKI